MSIIFYMDYPILLIVLPQVIAEPEAFCFQKGEMLIS